MTDDVARRPLRIIPVETPPMAVQPAALHQVERFQRALMPARVPAPERSARARATASTSGAPPAQGVHEPDDGPHVVASPRPGAAPSTPAVEGTRPRPPVTTAAIETAMPAADDLTEDAAEASAKGASIDPDEGGTGGWDDSLVRLVVRLCRGTDPSIEAWTVTVPLDPAVLPDTVLELALSPHRLTLRFITQAVESHRLLSRHQAALAKKLRSGLNSHREIDIEVN